MKLEICMGSSCFSRGNRENLGLIQRFVDESNLGERVEVVLAGSLCQNNCQRGPNMRIDGVNYQLGTAAETLNLLRQHLEAEDES